MSSTASEIEAIAARLAEVRKTMDEALVRAGRPRGSVLLLAVSKTKPVEVIRAAYAAGQRDFGENYAQELELKANELRDLPELRWHFIGRLQRNKAKQVVRVAQTVHAVDREELALELDRRAGALGVTLDVLVEVKVGDEASKGGCAPEALAALLASMKGCANLRVRGLMAIPPPSEDSEGARPYFAKLRALRDAHGGNDALPELSMGMTHDYPVAIEEGATIVRVGTAIFGARS